jgi:hypothetical protein
MRKWLQSYLESTFGHRLLECERQIGRLRLELQSAIEDAAVLHDKTYRLHQSMVKRHALAERREERKVEPESTNDAQRPMSVQERILERRRRNRGVSPAVQPWPGARDEPEEG